MQSKQAARASYLCPTSTIHLRFSHPLRQSKPVAERQTWKRRPVEQEVGEHDTRSRASQTRDLDSIGDRRDLCGFKFQVFFGYSERFDSFPRLGAKYSAIGPFFWIRPPFRPTTQDCKSGCALKFRLSFGYFPPTTLLGRDPALPARFQAHFEQGRALLLGLTSRHPSAAAAV